MQAKKEKEKFVVASLRPPCPGVNSLFQLYRYVPPHRVGFLCRFGPKCPNLVLNRLWFLREVGEYMSPFIV